MIHDSITNTFLLQPSGWAVQEASGRLGPDATDIELVRLAWEFVELDEQ